MNIGILGTGNVARTLAGGWAAAGHDITFGSREPGEHELDNPVAGREQTVRAADVVVSAVPGAAAFDVMGEIGPDAFAGKVLLDLGNAVTPDFAHMYPNASLAQKLQELLPDARVVKSLCTLAAPLMVDPSALGPTSVFVSSDDQDAKATVRGLLGDLGWPEDAIVDLGGIASARGQEHYFLLFAALMQARVAAPFNVRLVTAAG